MTNVVEIWTDGSCSAKDRVGGWGTIIIIDGVELELGGSALDTTSNRMEVMAVLKGLSAIHTPSKIKIFTDSQYVRNGIVKNGWVDKGPRIKNYDLWVRMNKLVNKHIRVKPIWVRGHSNIEHNERANRLAGQARLKRLKKVRGE